ncbi:hypothetical protein PF008_g20655 [Phytophthora fragariae]|uniref:Uncharacterized protein n=1 Tax=Phytophthora fragariae TaxID=53985 RepID=A0A6G0QZ46_9STRA|nr:hypothetical protein PF008_g20655 [Phytophthora fragariae]
MLLLLLLPLPVVVAVRWWLARLPSRRGWCHVKQGTAISMTPPKKAPANAHAAYLAPAPSCCASSGNAAVAAVVAAGCGGGADVSSRLLVQYK